MNESLITKWTPQCSSYCLKVTQRTRRGSTRLRRGTPKPGELWKNPFFECHTFRCYLRRSRLVSRDDRSRPARRRTPCRQAWRNRTPWIPSTAMRKAHWLNERNYTCTIPQHPKRSMGKMNWDRRTYLFLEANLRDNHHEKIAEGDTKEPSGLQDWLHARRRLRVRKFETGHGEHNFTGSDQDVLRCLPDKRQVWRRSSNAEWAFFIFVDDKRVTEADFQLNAFAFNAFGTQVVPVEGSGKNSTCNSYYLPTRLANGADDDDLQNRECFLTGDQEQQALLPA